MGSICIVTDSTCQMVRGAAPAPQTQLEIIQWEIKTSGIHPVNGESLKVSDLPPQATCGFPFHLTAPTVERIAALFSHLSKRFESIVGIFSSSLLGSCYDNAQKASKDYQGKVEIFLIDTQTFSVGLGYLVQCALDAAAQGLSASEIDRKVRNLCAITYSLICAPAISYLHHNGFVDHGQAMIGEMLGLYPIFTLESDKLLPIEKVRSYRQAITFFQEFLEEFEHVKHISVIKSPLIVYNEPRQGSGFLLNVLSKPVYSEHIINLPTAMLFGPTCLGMFIVEAENPRLH
ncbi:MAG: DegV family EDD domain-containing protein [Anaerolineae bacterium]|nr:DegV family EDD domain-containing protein [Anaerolineae bacterium]